MVRVDVIQRVMERQTNTNILFLDACRDNPLVRNLVRSMGTRSSEVGRGLAPVEFAATLKGSEVGVFFYVGHGLRVTGQNYLVLVDL